MLNRAFFSLQSPWIPTWVALGNLGFQVVLDIAFFRLGVWGIPLATSLVNLAGTGALILLFRRRIGSVEGRRIIDTYGRTIVASLVRRGAWRTACGGCSTTRSAGRAGRRSSRSGSPCSPPPRRFLGAARILRIRELDTLLDRSSGAPAPHESRPHPQLLHRRAHRPRQVHARGPDPRADVDADQARDARAGARLDGPRARARHHDQGAGRPRGVEGPPAEPDRHAGPRGLHLRGVARAPGVRGRAPPRGRRAGHPGADARERLPGDREQPRDRPGREQDRPAAGEPGRGRGRGRRAGRRGSRRASCASRRRPATGWRTCSTRSSSGSRRPRATRTRPPRALVFDSAYDQYRGVVAFVRVVDGVFHPRKRVRAMAQGTIFEVEELGAFAPDRRPEEDALRRRGRLRDHRPEGREPPARRRHADASTSARPRRRCPATRRSSRPSSRASSRPSRTSTRSCATRSRS